MYRILRLSVLIISLSGGNVVAHANNLSPRVNIGMSESSGNRIQHSDIDARFFPVWGDEARRRGYDIPEPFGIGYNYMSLRQDIIVDNIAFAMPSGKNLPGGLSVNAGHTRERSQTHMLKGDIWVFPFMNVYGMYGKTKGTSHTILKGGSFKLGSVRVPLKFLENQPFDLKFEGETYGGGVTLAGGWKHSFGTLDINYTGTNLDILDGDIKALVISPRIGYEFIFPSLISGEKDMAFQIWSGAMYQDITQRFKGNVSGLNLPVGFQQIVDRTGGNDMKFDVRQHISHKWSSIAGVRLEMSRHFSLLSEIGFNHRNSFFISGEFRF
ncbi:hypothetical protein [Escherichia coli]|uniref:hypothetical protein n=1 Tax=Escherichia coli TaxID=562 RepID=UPI0018B03E4A|nr:hypothetical protein [Escherichia coli]MBF9526499.1 hypothetical protein [Escherichia coli]